MIQDVDGVSRYIYPLVHPYTVIASRSLAKDVTIRPYAYSFDVFYRYNNPRHVTTSNVLFISITIACSPSVPTLYYTLIKYSTIFSFCSIHPIQHQPP